MLYMLNSSLTFGVKITKRVNRVAPELSANGVGAVCREEIKYSAPDRELTYALYHIASLIPAGSEYSYGIVQFQKTVFFNG